MKTWKKLAGVAVCSLMLGVITPGVRVAAAEADQLQARIEQLESEKAALEEEVKQLTEEKESLEARLGEEETAAPAPEVPENVAKADTSVEYSSKSIVIMVQQALNEKGYNCGTADGIAGSKTKESISAYEKDHGLLENGVITDQLLESLGLSEKVTEEAKKEAEKSTYSGDYSYQQLARNPDTYIGEKMKFSGKILQAQSGSSASYIRLAIDSDYDEVIFVMYDKEILDYKLLEDDKVTVYGLFAGDYSYESVLGATITIPSLYASIIELN